MTAQTTHVLMVRHVWMVPTISRAIAYLGILVNTVKLVRLGFSCKLCSSGEFVYYNMESKEIL